MSHTHHRTASFSFALLLFASRLLAAEETTLVKPPFGHCLGINRATNLHLFLYLGTRTSFNNPAGLAAVKLRSKDDPETSHDDDELTVFGLNSHECEIIYNTSLTNIEVFGECGSGRGQFRRPLGIAADEWGGVFVADTGNDRIVHLHYIDDELRHVGEMTTFDAVPDSLSAPAQLALGTSGTIYVTDSGNNRVLALTQSGGVTMSLDGDDDAGVQLDEPTGLAVVENDDPWINRREGRIVIADRGGTRLLSFDLDGTLRDAAAAGDGMPSDARFGYLAIDYHGSVYATDRVGSRIHKFDRRLRYVTTFYGAYTGSAELDEPRGIAIWRRFGQVFVAERQGARYFWMGTEIQELSVASDEFRPGAAPLHITYFLTEVSRISIQVNDVDGRSIHTIADNRRRAIGPNAERWDGLLEDGQPLPPGEYTLLVTANPVYSSRAYFHDSAQRMFIVNP
ncbi:hypothetical protein K8S17_02320 [bacterium]|nr:hypothetical protein [bacterium]